MSIGRVKNYPWYQDLVSLLSLITVLVSAWTHYTDLPDILAIHFDWNGHPNGYGSKGLTLAFILGMIVLQWAVDVAVRYQFLLAETRKKRLNWIQLFTVPGVMVVAGSWHLIVDFNLHGGPLKPDWKSLLSWLFVALIFLFLSEKVRPQGECEGRPLSSFGEELSTQLPERFCLVDHVAPRWWVHLMIWPGLMMLLGGFYMMFVPGWLMKGSGLATILGGLLTLLFAGGFRFVLHNKGLEIQFGTLSVPIKFIATDQIETFELTQYNALADFGGWGLRWGRNNTTAYIISGDVGLLVKTAKRNYLIGSTQSRVFYTAMDQLVSRKS